MTKESKKEHKNHGFLEINSYSLSQGLINFRVGAFGSLVFFFYETEIKLNPLLLLLAWSIYIIIDAFNDPYLGNLTDKPNRMTKRWGRRFPWVILGVFPWALIYILLFTTPDPNQSGDWIVFVYITVILVLNDTFYTLWNVNSEALFPFKFREMKERRKVSGTKAFWGIIGLALGLIGPPLLFDYGNKQSYIVQGIVFGFITFVIAILMIPGHREEQKIVDDYLSSEVHEKERPNFIKALIAALKKKNFLLLIALHFFYTVLTGLLIASLNYFLRYNLQLDEDFLILPMIGYVVSSLLLIPIWITLSNKMNNNKKMVFIGSILMATATFFLLFANSLIYLIINACLIGATGGIYLVMQDAVFADVLDENVVLDGERREATYLGIKFFLGRFAGVFQATSMIIIHILTGFNPELAIQPSLALFGIRIHLAIIPAISLLLGGIIFWKFYGITPSKSSEVQAKIGKLKI
jgi:GPH family glycoside/pentoside/hexuronide:cation symporter